MPKADLMQPSHSPDNTTVAVVDLLNCCSKKLQPSWSVVDKRRKETLPDSSIWGHTINVPQTMHVFRIYYHYYYVGLFVAFHGI